MIFVPANHPSVERLREMGIAISDQTPDTPVRRIVILNLMPQKQEAEEEYYVAMSEAGIDIQIVLAKMSGLTYKTTPQTYMDTFYTDIADIMASGDVFDGMIVSGAPLEQYEYTQVTYWEQLHEVYHWTFSHVRSTLNVCWGAFASLRMFFGIDKHWTPAKLFGVYVHENKKTDEPLLEGLPLEVNVPISRHITLVREELEAQDDLQILLDQNVTGPEMAISWNGRHVYANGHMEYAEGRLRFEYERDIAKGLPIDVPYNYFNNDNPEQGVNVSWQETGRKFYTNWLIHYVDNEKLPMIPADIDFKA